MLQANNFSGYQVRGERVIALAILSLGVTGCTAQSGGWNWRLWVWSVMFLILALVAMLLISLILEWQKTLARSDYQLEIHNTGNVATGYAVQAEALSAGLTFTFVRNGIPLLGGELSPSQQPGSESEAVTVARPARRANLKKAKGLLRFGNMISGLLINLGNLLPYSIGVNLIRVGSKLRRSQGAVEQVERGSSQLSHYSATGKSRGASVRKSVAVPDTHTDSTPEWVKIPSIDPGRVLILELHVDPANPYRSQQVPFILRSYPLGQPEAGIDIGEHIVSIIGLTPFQKYGPFLLLLVGTIVCLILTALLTAAS